MFARTTYLLIEGLSVMCEQLYERRSCSVFSRKIDHFLGEDRVDSMLGPAALLQLQATENPRSVPHGVGPGTPPEPCPATAEQLNLAVRQAGMCGMGPMACPGPGNTLSREFSQEGYWGRAGQDPGS